MRQRHFARVVVVVGCLFLAAPCVRAANPPLLKRVLVLHQELASRPFRTRFNAAFIDALRAGDGASIDIYEEAIDTERFSGGEQVRLLSDYLRNKYSDRKIDILVAVGNNALRFARENLEAFGNPLIVATSPRPGVIGLDEISTGLQGGFWIDGTLDLALTLRPAVERVIVVDGMRNNTGDLQSEFERRVSQRRDRLQVEYLRDLALSDLVDRVAAISDRAVVVFIRQTIGNEWDDLDPFEGLAQVVRASHVPVFAQLEEFLGRGVIGGYMWRFEDDARRMAEMTRLVANGTSPGDIPVGRTSYAAQFDWRQLRRWGIAESALPAGSVVLFRPQSFFQLYRPYVAAGLVIFTVQAALIVGLGFQRVRRRRAEEESRHNEERYRSVVDTQSELICRFLPDTTLTFVNDAYCRFWRKSRHELLGIKFIELIPPSARAAVVERIAGLTSGMDSHEHQVTLADGTIGWHHWINHAIVDQRGQVIELQGVGRDITDRKRAEEAIVQLEARNGAMLRAIPDLMFVLGRDGSYIDYHAKDVRQLFLPPSGFLGKRVRDIMPPALADVFMSAIERACETQETVVVEYELPIDGTRYYEARLVHAGNDRVLSIVRDVTESRRATDLNRDLAGRLIASQEVERHRIARELHDDLSQKIALLNVNIDLLARKFDTEQQKFRELRERASEIATDLHNLSHELHPSKLQTLGLVPSLQSLCRDISRQSGVEVLFMHDAVPPSVDPTVSLCIYRIAQEALHNVARHSRALQAELRLMCDDDGLVLRLCDSGVGFDPKDRRHAGLGLISMHERVAFLKGQLSIQARPGGGTRIDVRIPLDGAHAASESPISHIA